MSRDRSPLAGDLAPLSQDQSPMSGGTPQTGGGRPNGEARHLIPTALNAWVRNNRSCPLKELAVTLRRKLAGYFNYYGVIGNSRDVLRPAEYRRYSDLAWSSHSDKASEEKAIRDDWDEYQAWLTRK